MFGTFMTIIIIGYVGYYGYNIIHDLYFDKTGEVVATASVEEQEVDIKDELGSFTQFDADEDRKVAEQKRKAKEAQEKAEKENGSAFSQKSSRRNDDDSTTMTGGVEADDVQGLVDSLEKKGPDSDFNIVARALSPSRA
jgi:sensor c-di-GMP phosphodiesterase-like protein